MKKKRTIILLICILSIIIAIPVIYFTDKPNNIKSIPDLKALLSEKKINTINETNLSIIGTTTSNDIVCLNYGDENGKNSKLKFFNSDFSKCTSEICPQDSKKQIYSACVTEDSIFWVESSFNAYRDDWVMYRFNLNNKFTLEVSRSTATFENLSLTTPTLIGPELSCDKNNVIWSTYENTGNGSYKAVVRLLNTKLGSSKIIDSVNTTEGKFNLPSLNNGYAIYSLGKILITENSAGLDSKVYLLNLSTKEKITLCDKLNSLPMAIVYPKVIYSDSSNLHLYDIKSKNDTIIQGSACEKWGFSHNDKYITWFDNLGKGGLRLYSIEYNKFFSINDNLDITTNAINDNILYWTTSSSPNKIFYIKLD